MLFKQRKKLDLYGNLLIQRKCQKWFAKFCSCNIDVENAPSYKIPVEDDKDEILTEKPYNKI